MRRLVALAVVVFVAATLAATPVGAAKPTPALSSVTTELGLNCTVQATAHVDDLRGRYFVYFVVRGAKAGLTNQTLATADVRASQKATTVVAQLPLATGDWAQSVLAYLHDAPIDGHWTNVGFSLEEVNYPCGM